MRTTPNSDTPQWLNHKDDGTINRRDVESWGTLTRLQQGGPILIDGRPAL